MTRTAELETILKAAQDKLGNHKITVTVNAEWRTAATEFVQGKLKDAEAAVLAAAPVSDSSVASIISDDLEPPQPELLTPSQVKELLVPIQGPVSGQEMDDALDILIAEGREGAAESFRKMMTTYNRVTASALASNVASGMPQPGATVEKMLKELGVVPTSSPSIPAGGSEGAGAQSSKREAPLVPDADKELEEAPPAQRRKEGMHLGADAAEAEELNRAGA